MLVWLERIFSLSLSGANHLIAAEEFFYPSCAPLSLFYLVALLVRTMFTFFAIHHEKFFFCPFNLDHFIGSFAGTVDIFDELPTKHS